MSTLRGAPSAATRLRALIDARRRRLRASVLAAVWLAWAAIGTAWGFDGPDDERTWAVTGVAVIDVETGAISSDRTILVRSGVIQAVGPSDAIPLPEGTIVVAAPGRYVIPGLWDMHVHIRGGRRLADANERWLRQYLAFGVTAVRDAGGDLPDLVLRFREGVTRGEVIGPRLFSSLRKIDGREGAWAGSVPVASTRHVAAAIDRLHAEGADFVKLYDGSIEPQVFLEAVREADRRGLLTAGHIPLSVPFLDAVNAGLDSVEHAFHLLKAAHPRDRAVSRRFTRRGIPEDFEPFFVAVAGLGKQADEARARRVFRVMVEQETAVTPTLYIRGVWNRVTAHDFHLDDPRLADVPEKILETYRPGLDTLAGRTAEERASDASLERLSLRLTRLAANEGVTILAGSDTGAGNPFVYPGDSLHHELEALVDAGLSPLRALQAATVEPARWFGRSDELGTVGEGKLADFLILAANPLVEIENTRSLVGVVQQGVYFDAAELAALKSLGEWSESPLD